MAGYIGTQAVSVNTTSATISDDLTVGDDATITGDLDVDGTTNLDVVNAVGAFSVTGTRSGDFLAKITSSNTYGLLVKTTSTSASHEQVQFVDANDSVLFKVLGNGAATIKTGLTLTDGDLIVASGHGVSFAATGNGSGSSQNELLDDYEEGTWAATGNGITLADQVSRYVKVGNIVHVGCKIVFPTTSDTGLAQIDGFPFASVDSQAARAGLVVSWQDEGSSNGLQILVGTNAANAQLYLGSATKSNANMSGHTVFFGGTYLSDN